jgi:hypothetical protein
MKCFILLAQIQVMKKPTDLLLQISVYNSGFLLSFNGSLSNCLLLVVTSNLNSAGTDFGSSKHFAYKDNMINTITNSSQQIF